MASRKNEINKEQLIPVKFSSAKLSKLYHSIEAFMEQPSYQSGYSQDSLKNENGAERLFITPTTIVHKTPCGLKKNKLYKSPTRITTLSTRRERLKCYPSGS